MSQALKSVALASAKISGALGLSDWLLRGQVRILSYHGAWITPGYVYSDKMYIPVEQFRQRMQWLKASKYRVITLDEAIDGLESGELPDRSVVITFDDGWRTSYSHMLPILQELELPATIYLTTWYVENALPVLDKVVDFLVTFAKTNAVSVGGRSFELGPDAALQIVRHIESQPLDLRMSCLGELSTGVQIPDTTWQTSGQFDLMKPAEVIDAAKRGFDIQLHTHRHTELDTEVGRLEDEISDNRLSISRLLPKADCTHFCYPSGVFHPQAPSILQASKVRSATLCTPGLNKAGCDLMTLKRFLDGRSVTQPMFEAWLSGLTSVIPGKRSGASF
ncbi:MAG: polysaccharide deacetylase family protein [Burkholderiaceae bacterium]